MVKRNLAFCEIQPSYLFVEIANRQAEFLKKHPDSKVISLGIGNTTEPLLPPVVEGIKTRAVELSTVEGYRGYGDFNGDPKLRKLISKVIYNSEVGEDEIFVSDGSKPDLARMQFLFGCDSSVAVQDPTYPVYVDSSVISGKAGKFDKVKNGYENIVKLRCVPENDFFPDLSTTERTDLIYFCSPNNPTGSVATKAQLKELVDFAKRNKSIIIFDAAYAEFVRDTETYPKSIFEIPGARDVAIETNSFSKTLGFTGVRLGWTVCPKELKFDDGSSVHSDWSRIMGTFLNGPSNVSEAGAIAALTDGGSCLQTMTSYYLENAKIIRSDLQKAGKFKFYGGENSPYIWVQMPEGQASWDVFQGILDGAHVVTTPGDGFGYEGRRFIRISAFAHREDVVEAMARILKYFSQT